MLKSTLGKCLALLAALCIQLCVSAPAFATGLTGKRVIALHTAEGTSISVGTVTFTPVAEGQYTFSVQMDIPVFTDHFLSMKEFKCIGGTPELMCLVPYPYQAGNTVSETDFAWLEHALLFMFKRPADFGAKLWNGVYFKLVRTPTGLLGKPQAVDLNQISAPPANLAVPPFEPSMRDDYPPGSRWIRSVTIE